jgi:hypothetical protein
MLRPLRTLCVVTKKLALGGLERAQVLRNLSDASTAPMPLTHSLPRTFLIRYCSEAENSAQTGK